MSKFQPTIPVVYGQPVEILDAEFESQFKEVHKRTDGNEKRAEYKKQVTQDAKYSRFVEKLVTIVFTVAVFFCAVGAVTVYHWFFG